VVDGRRLTPRTRWADLFAAFALVVLSAAMCGQPDRAKSTVVGVLPDGTRYELVVPAWMEPVEAVGISGAPIWTDARGIPGDAVVGATNFGRFDQPTDRVVATGTSIVDGRLFARAGAWAMVIDLYAGSAGREAELELIEAREQDGLIVIDLPPSLRFATTEELPISTGVSYRWFDVVRGCSAEWQCSPDRQLMLVPTDPRPDLSEVRLRTLTG